MTGEGEKDEQVLVNIDAVTTYRLFRRCVCIFHGLIVGYNGQRSTWV